MQPLNLPTYPFTIKESQGKKKIFDRIRKKMVALTPEEWVRQHFICYLIEEKGYPASLTSVETPVKINGLSQRADIVVYNKYRKPVLIVECKAPHVKITPEVFDQAARYNIRLQTRTIAVTNGLNHYFALVNKDGMSYSFLKDIPFFNHL
jgi:type I site-specific restriction endonuclease